MVMNRIVEYVFFFGFMAVVGYLLFVMFSPFISALALSAITVTISYPLHMKVRRAIASETIAALVTTLLVLCIFILPLFLLTSTLLNEAVSIYKAVSAEQVGVESSLQNIESLIQRFVPGFDLEVTEYLKQSASWLAGHLGAFFAGTASTLFLVFISIIGSFYLFRDGEHFTRGLVRISPLPDTQDAVIMDRLARAVRSVAIGTVLIAIIQGTLTALGLWIFGFERAVLWGLVAAFGALIPGVGTMIVFAPAVAYLAFAGEYFELVGVAVWGVAAVGLIDNLLGPYLMSRGNSLHPFLILLSVLGGIATFGPIGFVVGPVLMSLFMVLLELYSTHISDQKHKASK
jgi:predicted PurR-regulated permease PerM